MDFLSVLLGVYGVILGAALASFGCVIAERVPRGEPFAGGRSHCACGRQLRVWENVPVLGWVRTWGHGRCCGSKIPARYVLAELGGGAFGWGVAVTLVAFARDGVPVWALVLTGVSAIIGLMWLVVSLTWVKAVQDADSVADGAV